MISKSLFLISVGVAAGLFLATNADFKKNNLVKMVKRIESCVKTEFADNESSTEFDEGIYRKKIYPKNNN
jgi:hypothetical protein